MREERWSWEKPSNKEESGADAGAGAVAAPVGLDVCLEPSLPCDDGLDEDDEGNVGK